MSYAGSPAEPQLPGVDIWTHADGRQVQMRPPGQKRGVLYPDFTKASHAAIDAGLAPVRCVFIEPKNLSVDDYPTTYTRKTEESA